MKVKLLVKSSNGNLLQSVIFDDALSCEKFKRLLEESGAWGKIGEYYTEESDPTQELSMQKLKQLFSGIRLLWQQLSDDFAANNAILGITQEGKTKEIADKFNGVIYYLNANAPMEAIRELNLITTDPKYVTPEVITKMSNALLGYIQDNK